MEPATNQPDEPGAGREADDRLVHALLLHLHDDQSAQHREQRVQRVMSEIRNPGACQDRPAPRSLVFRLWTTRSAWAAAALLLVAIAVWVFTTSPTPAMASLNDIIESLGRPGDRTYHIRMEDLPEPPGRRPLDDRPPEPRPGLDEATLYLRDGRQYLLARHDPKGGLIFDGWDGEHSWRLRAGQIAETREGPGAGGIPMPPMMADVPFSNLHQTLERIRVDYTVEQLDQARLAAGGEWLRHARVRRNSREVKGPETIEIWANPRTALPQRIVFDDAKIQGNRSPCRLTFDLASEESLPTDWFQAETHAATRPARQPAP